MRFVYEYRTSDNVRHKGEVCAANREAAYDLLRKQGVRPGSLADAPGVFNKLFGKGKRWLAIGVLSLGVIAFAVYAMVLRRASLVPQESSRSQIYGDPTVLQLCEAQGWTNVFPCAADCFLAAYAIPGRVVSGVNAPATSELVEASRSPVSIEPVDEPEVSQMKRMVNGMKRELSEYLAAGGDVGGYVAQLRERQETEAVLFKSVSDRFDAMRTLWREKARRAELIETWKSQNAYLRDMGLRSIPLPEEWLKNDL